MKIKTVQKPLKIGSGVQFDEAIRVYDLFIRKLSKKEQSYTPIKPLFITIGKDRLLELHESVSQVSISVPNNRCLSKRGWCDKITLK